MILRLLHVRECVAPGSFSVRVAACDCACVCVCALYAVGISSASAAQLNLSQRWVLMSFSSVGVARLARLDVHFCDRFSLSQPNERLATDLNDSFASVLPVRFRYRFNVCRYCAYGYYCQSGQTWSLLMDFSLRQSALVDVVSIARRLDANRKTRID